MHVCFGAGYAVRERKKKFAHWSALHGGFCGARVGPFAKCGLNEALLAIVLAWPCLFLSSIEWLYIVRDVFALVKLTASRRDAV